MKINQKSGLNKKARAFLLEHCISRRAAEVLLCGFTGYINGREVQDETLIRTDGEWRIFLTTETIQSISGQVSDGFYLTRNSI